MTLKHTFVSAIADDGAALAAGEVVPQTHWNADHTVSGTSLQVQYNNAGSLTGMGGTSWDNTNQALTIAAIANPATATLTLTGGTAQTTNQSVLRITQTWNNAAVTFDAPLFMNITNTASNAASLLADFQLAGTSILAIGQGNATEGILVFGAGGANGAIGNYIPAQGNITGLVFYTGTGPASGVLANISNASGIPQVLLPSTGFFGWGSTVTPWANQDALLYRQAAGTVGLHHGTLSSPAALQIFNTSDVGAGAPTNYERATIDWTTTANVLTIGSQKGGTGSSRDVAVVVGGTEVHRALAAGNVKFSNAASFSANGSVATVLGSVGPTGASTTVTKWLTIVDSGGVTRYIPCF